ncbi:O-antigen ligase family protein [Aquihabitans daechungensis]|uniref:O-antigen ligase family protein n=1 Tax=Aquihabitans daechungensis TaxID=1052257 RepID=UPI003BA30076
MNPVVAPAPGATSTTPADPALEEPVDAPAAEAPADDESRVAATIIALLMITIPLADAHVAWSVPGAVMDWNRSVIVAPFDLVLLVAVGWTLLRPRLLADLFRSRAVQVVSGLYAATFAVALVAGFSWLGVNMGLRLGAGLVVIAVVAKGAESAKGRQFMLGTIVVVGVLQAVLGMAQSANGIAFGIDYLDYAGRLYPFGDSRAGRGGLGHPYHLAVLLVVAQGAALLGLRYTRSVRWPWIAGLAVLGAGIAVTYTRAGAIGQVLLVICLLLGRRDRRILLPAAAAIVLGLAIGGVAFGDGWLARSEVTINADGTQNVSSSRSERLREAQELIEANPAVGVGPGNYVDALHAEERIEYLPAHNLVAQEAAEMGILGGIAALALLGLLGSASSGAARGPVPSCCRSSRSSSWTPTRTCSPPGSPSPPSGWAWPACRSPRPRAPSRSRLRDRPAARPCAR